MKILVVGGTKFAGVHLVKQLLSAGHEVTIATRGKTKDSFGNAVSRIILERTNQESISRALRGKFFDVVYDSQAHSSNEVKYLLDAVSCGKYIEVSTVSVYYPKYSLSMPETDFAPTTHPLKWCTRTDFEYDEIKRQAECAMFQTYKHIPSIAVRLPLIIGPDDYTNRLYFYVEKIINAKPMHVDNIDAKLEFILSSEAGQFLAWLADKNFTGSINAANRGNITLNEIIKYTENKASAKAIISTEGEPAPFNGFPTYGLDLTLATGLGYRFPHITAPMHNLLDAYVQTAQAANKAL